jgi:hypothetical protein
MHAWNDGQGQCAVRKRKTKVEMHGMMDKGQCAVWNEKQKLA